MKLKQFFAAALLLVGVGASAQTDVTSTYLTNADFSQTTPLDNGLCGYGKDMSGKGTTYYGLQAIDGWTSFVVSGDNSNNSYPNSGMGGAVFEYGSEYLMMGNNKTAPSADPDGNEGKCLGFFGVWGCGGYYYQEVTLAAGKYTINIPVYSQSGTQANTSYIGWIPNSGTSYTMATNPTVGSWTTLTTTFTLTDATTGKICLGYKSNGSGSSANAMLYFDKVQILYTATVVKDVLSTALTAATNANSTLNDSDLTTAIATAQAVYDDADATQNEVNDAAVVLNNATELAMSAAGDVTGVFLSNPGFESCTVTTTNAAAGGSAAPLDIAGGWTQVSSAAWSSSAVVAYGGEGQINGASAPSADNAGNSGNALGVSVGWGGLVTYQSNAVTLPAGVYTLQVNAYNNLSGVTQFASKFGFIPTVGDASLSTKNSFTYAAWETDKVTFTLNEATEGKIQIGGQAISGGSGSNAKVFFDNITITYRSFLAGAKAEWDEAKAAAEAARDNDDYSNIAGSELTTLQEEINKAEPTTVDGYNEAATALNTATQTFIAAKAAYDAYANFLTDYLPENELTYAATEKYTAIGDAYMGEGDVENAADATARVAAAKTALRAYYESHALAEKAEGAVNCADAIAGADANTNTGWTGGIGTDARDWEMYTDASGNAGGRYYDGGWSTSAGANINMSRSINLPAGTYLLTVTARGSENLTSYTMSIGDESVDLPRKGGGENVGVFGHGWDDVSLKFTSDGHPVTLTIAAASTDYQQWISFNRFRLMRLSLNTSVYADADDYEALNNAIETAEAMTLGFEDGEYAPYNNVAALEALAAAKAFDQTAELTNFKTDVEAATIALDPANWTANDGDVDAIYNGTFAETGTGSNPKGWTRSNNGWGQQITGLTAEANGVAEGTTTAWYYNTNGSWQYGNDGFYTMPLAAEQTYELSFKYSKNGNDWQAWMKASVTNEDNEGLEVAQFAAAENGSNYVAAKAYFTTGAAGNYILSIEQNGNAHLTDVTLVKTESATLALNEGTAYEALNRVYYETVNMTRKVVDGFNTVCLPFDLTAEQVASAFGTGAEVYAFSENSENAKRVTINFNKVADGTISANVPVLVKATAESDEQVFEGVDVKAAEEAKVEGANFDFVGVYAPATVEALDYFIGNGAIYKSAGSTNIKAFRAYLDNKTPEITGNDASEEEVKMYIDGLETSISEINGNAATSNDAIFNLAGQRVQKAQKGLYIVNGKKVIVK